MPAKSGSGHGVSLDRNPCLHRFCESVFTSMAGLLPQERKVFIFVKFFSHVPIIDLT